MITCERGFHRAGGDRVVVARAGGAGGRRGGGKRKKGRKEKGGYEEEQLIKIWRQEFHVSIALTEAIERGKGERLPMYTRNTFGDTLYQAVPPSVHQ
jgi:hypothetical protein